MTQARRRSKCWYCPEPITQLQPEVIGRSRYKRGERTFTRIQRWHPQCWINQGLQHIEAHPVVIRAGRPKIALDPEKRKVRLRLLRRHAQDMHYYREAMEAGKFLYAARCAIRAIELEEKIAEVGGVPRSWRQIPSGSPVDGEVANDG